MYRHTRGFTLIEIMIVLVIVAIITAVAVIAFGSFGRDRREKIIVEQFAQTIAVAQQQAIFTPTAMGLGITSGGYRYYEYQQSFSTKKAHWVVLPRGALSHPNAFAHVFDANIKNISAFEATQKSTAATPSIIFLPSGTVTPFVLDLRSHSNHFVITVKNNGAVRRDQLSGIRDQ